MSQQLTLVGYTAKARQEDEPARSRLPEGEGI